MADILKIYTAEQLNDMYRLYLLAKGVGLTDFNEGSKTATLIESNSDIISSISMDFKEALMKAIPIALYEGFGFGKTEAVSAIGFIRPYRKPAFTVQYTGAGTSALLTSNAAGISAVVVGAPADAFTVLYAGNPTVQDAVNAIDTEINWTATIVRDGDADSIDIYQYTNEEIINAINWLNADGFDVMLDDDLAIAVPVGFSANIDDIQILTTAVSSIPAGESGVQIAAEVSAPGVDGNILSEAVDTRNGKGVINSSIDGIEYAINDSAFSGGETAETSSERKVRFNETVNNLNAGTSGGIIAEIKKITGVRSVGIRESFPFKGTNTIIVDDGTGTISATLLAAVELRLYGDPNDLINYPGKNAAGISYIIAAPVIVDVNLSITIYKLATVNVDNTTISTAVKSAIEQYINTRKLGEYVVLTEGVRVARNASAAVYDLAITSPGSNVVILANEFAKTGAGTTGVVTVTMVTV